VVEKVQPLGPLINAQAGAMRPRHLARHGYLPPTGQPHIGNGLVGGAKGPRGDEAGAPPGAAGDARDARGVEGLGPGQRRQDGGEPARQPRCARPPCLANFLRTMRLYAEIKALGACVSGSPELEDLY
jgi:hypothetical protein